MGNPSGPGLGAFGPGPPVVPPAGSTLTNPVLVNPTFSPAGTAGQLLTSQGAGTPPTWTTGASGITGFSTALPPSPTSTSLVMYGMAAGAAPSVFTPTRSGRMLVFLSGNMRIPQGSAATVGMTVSARFGTGTPPAQGAPVVGTAFTVGSMWAMSGVAQPGGNTGDHNTPFTLQGVFSSPVGTPVWVDLCYAIPGVNYTTGAVFSGASTASWWEM